MDDHYKQYFKGKSILLIDDDDHLTNILMRLLGSAGFEASVISDPRQIHNVYRKDSFDIVLLDMRMPYMGGKDVAKIIKNISPTQKIIISSGFIEEENLEFTILHKPYPAGLLFYTLRKELELENDETRNEQQMQKKES